MEEKVRIFLKAGEEKKYITSLEHEMFTKGVSLSRTGDIQRLTIGNDSTAVEIEIPRAWVPDMITTMITMLDDEDAFCVLKDLEQLYLR